MVSEHHGSGPSSKLGLVKRFPDVTLGGTPAQATGFALSPQAASAKASRTAIGSNQAFGGDGNFPAIEGVLRRRWRRHVRLEGHRVTGLHAVLLDHAGVHLEHVERGLVGLDSRHGRPGGLRVGHVLS